MRTSTITGGQGLWRLVSLAVLPVLFVSMLSVFSIVKAPYWSEPDPNYHYYISTVNLANFEHVWFHAHPGVPVKIFGAIIMRVTHAIVGQHQFSTGVLTNPELYMRCINAGFIMMCGILLFMLGVETYRCTEEVWLAACAQMTPLFSLYLFCSEMVRVCAEPMLYCISLGLAIILVRMVRVPFEKEPLRYSCLLAMVVGLGITTKLNFIPLVVIPALVVPGIRWRAALAVLCLISVVVFLLPVISDYRVVIGKFTSLATTGTVRATGIGWSPRVLAGEGLNVFNGEHPQIAIVALCGAVVVSTAVLGLFKKDLWRSSLFRILIALFAGVCIQLFAVIRARRAYYSMPSAALSGTMLALSLYQMRTWFIKRYRVARILVYSVTVALAWFSYCEFAGRAMLQYRGQRVRRLRALEFNDLVERNATNCARVYCRSLGLPCGALKEGTHISGETAGKMLSSLYPSTYFYSFYEYGTPPERRYRDWENKGITFKEIWRRHTNVMFVGKADYSKDHGGPTESLRDMLNRKEETIYLYETNYLWKAPQAPATIDVEHADSSNLELIEDGERGSILTHGKGGYVTFEVMCSTGAAYRLSATLCCMVPRPFDVLVNGEKVLNKVGGVTTEGWDISTARRFELGTIFMSAGANQITLTNCSMDQFAGVASITIEQ